MAKDIRLTSSVKCFPWSNRSLCCFEVSKDGAVNLVNIFLRRKAVDALKAVKRAQRGESTLYIAWPIGWTTDLFRVDNLDSLYSNLMEKYLKCKSESRKEEEING